MPARKPKSQVQRNLKLRRANRVRGLRSVQLWVPQYRVHEMKQLAREWREEHARVNAESEVQWIGDSNKSIDEKVYGK